MTEGACFGRYQVTRLIGAGGMGEIYEAIHLDLKKRVALKLMMKEKATNERALARFMREGKAAARIRHPNVVDVTDVGVERGLPYLVMELLDGENLGGLIARKGRLEVEDAVDLMLGVLAALEAAHDAGVVHRDLKPENIFLTVTQGRTVEPKVLDFGISKLVGPNDQEALTRSHAVMGTPYYMSPEQARGAKHVDARTDQYAAAVVLYECLTGALPYGDGNMLEVLHLVQLAAIIPPRRVRGDLPPGLEAVILRAMAYDPAARYRSVRDLGAALLPFASGKGHVIWASVFGASSAVTASSDEMAETVRHVPSFFPVSWTRDQRRTHARLVIGGVAVVVLATLVGVAAFAMPRSEPPRRSELSPEEAVRPAKAPPPAPEVVEPAPEVAEPAPPPPPEVVAPEPAPPATTVEPTRPTAAQRQRARQRTQARRTQDEHRSPVIREGRHGSIIVN